MKTFPVLLLLCIFLNACGGGKALQSVREDFYSTITEYNDLLKQNQFDKAKQFVYASVREEFDVRAKKAKNIMIRGYNYNIKNSDFETDKGEIIVEVKIDYRIPPSETLKTLLDSQDWSFVYVKEDKKKRWMLMTPLPEFR